jgi:ligand-binding sensor domain-containing protein
VRIYDSRLSRIGTVGHFDVALLAQGYRTHDQLRHYTVVDGMTDMKVECVFCDSGGRLWVGTHDRGVLILEGEQFRSLTVRDGLAGNGVYDIIEHDDSLLLYTSGGLQRLRDETLSTLPRMSSTGSRLSLRYLR